MRNRQGRLPGLSLPQRRRRARARCSSIEKADGFGLVSHFAFDPSKVNNDEIFTLPHQVKTAWIYLGDNIIRSFDDAGLTYAPFKLLFDEAAGFAQETYL